MAPDGGQQEVAVGISAGTQVLGPAMDGLSSSGLGASAAGTCLRQPSTPGLCV